MSRGADAGRFAWSETTQRRRQERVVPLKRLHGHLDHAAGANRCESCAFWQDAPNARPRETPQGLAYAGQCTNANGPVRHAAHSLRLACPQFVALKTKGGDDKMTQRELESAVCTCSENSELPRPSCPIHGYKPNARQ